MLLLLLCIAIISKGQTQPYGIIDTADIKLTSCDFEKGANAMVLFDKTEVNTVNDITIITLHKRIKILTEEGLNVANVTLAYYSKDHFEKVSDIEAQTINLDHGALRFTPIDKSLIYKQVADKNTKTLTFSFPAVKAGSVIEYKYKITIDFPGTFPNWNFQRDIPVKYSQLSLNISRGFSYTIVPRVYEEYEKNIKEAIRGTSGDSIGTHYLWGVKNIASFRDEPYTTCPADNIQNIRFFLFQTPFANLRPRVHTWPYVTGLQLNDPDFRHELGKDLKDEYNLLPQAKLLKTEEEKINFIYNGIKNNVRWNNRNNWDTYDGVKKAWEKKEGNSAEINLILYNFLRQAGFKCLLTYVSTRDNGKVETELPDMDDFNTMALSITTAAEKTLVLDASNKFNIYNATPFNLLNCYALTLDPNKKSYALKVLKNEIPVKKLVIINAQINAGGKLEGSAHIYSSGCTRTNNLKRYADLGEAKYKDELKNNDNNLKLISLKRENLDTDTLPLIESVDFQLDLISSDESYIYVNPTLFTSFIKNPFLNEKRIADIDFGTINSYSIKSLYKVPTGYKIESLPQGISMAMPDKSINFKRIVGEQDGQILIRYIIDYERSIFTANEYPSIRDFYKKMYEMLNEQIVLKKI